MLIKILIENLALVQNVELEFEPGLVVLTGETGAGKSVIVTALSLALGERADREFIRNGADRCLVEATFDVTRTSPEFRKANSDFIENGQIHVSRELTSDGKSKIKINSTPTTLAQLKIVTSPVVEILGQHAAQMLMNEDNHLSFLDHFAALDGLKVTVADAYDEWKRTASELATIRSKREQITRERELLLFQRNEIEKAQITVGEEERILSERKILDSARTLMASAALITNTFESEENSISSMLTVVRREMERMAETDASLEQRVAELADISYQLEDLRAFVEQYGSSIQDDPQRIEEINLRLDEIYTLKKKYGGSEQSILECLNVIRSRLTETPPDIDTYIDELDLKCQKLFKEYSRHALALTDARKKAAGNLRRLVIKELQELAIDNGGFEFEFVYEDDPEGVVINARTVKPSPNGLEKGRIMFSANPGEPLKSLVKTASGGEISRVLLALKSAEKKNNKLLHSLLVFDEVDSGIGGQTAVKVGQKLRRLSDESQLLVITHLHQIAREGNHHFVAEKKTGSDKRAIINVRRLDAEGIRKELSRMVALPEQ